MVIYVIGCPRVNILCILILDEAENKQYILASLRF